MLALTPTTNGDKMFPYEADFDPVADAEQTLAYREVLREEAVLAALDPDRIRDDELPSDVPPAAAAEWWEFVALCARVEAGDVVEQSEESDRSAGCP